MNKNDVLIKWTGSKRSQADEIIKYFPKKINRYIEPFCGSSSMLWELINSDIEVGSYILSDVNMDLINLWNKIKESPKELISDYEYLWDSLNSFETKEYKTKYYNFIREHFNKIGNPSDFLFLNRTCYNGLIRYNKNGDFNTSFHFSRKGIDPASLNNIIGKWNAMLNLKEVKFNLEDYINIISGKSDFMYLDPPYANSKGMYFGGIDLEELFEYLRRSKSKWILSFDGIRGENDMTYEVPKDIYKRHILINSGESSFSKLKGKNVNVKESIYINY